MGNNFTLTLSDNHGEMFWGGRNSEREGLTSDRVYLSHSPLLLYHSPPPIDTLPPVNSSRAKCFPSDSFRTWLIIHSLTLFSFFIKNKLWRNIQGGRTWHFIERGVYYQRITEQSSLITKSNQLGNMAPPPTTNPPSESVSVFPPHLSLPPLIGDKDHLR
ncbi:unnamed protein product [Trypanosoma congolense IL3000]|uniref:WGS project CAEQ00000000 data, annotated contig 1263 n=1 Tax=Trypanosoma congolense (strain IL3000) TaxID=1068625 RepID=F9W513_TRYCI|nr:unnamed protein product [Trypanosoma congolense IL3000]